METFWKVKEVAAVVQVSVGTIYRYVEIGQIPFHKLNRALRFKPSEIEIWMENRKAGTAVNIKNLEGGLTDETADSKTGCEE
jgi:excisionase family DNA binding protein